MEASTEHGTGVELHFVVPSPDSAGDPSSDDISTSIELDDIGDSGGDSSDSLELSPLVNASRHSYKSFPGSEIAHEPPNFRNSSFSTAVFNSLNATMGPALLTMPYSLSLAGWFGLIPFFMIPLLGAYTSILLARCLGKPNQPALRTYVEVAENAFGTVGKRSLAIVQYGELFCTCVSFLILEAHSLQAMFPTVMGYEIGRSLWTLLTVIVIFPTVCLKDMKSFGPLSGLAFVSVMLVVVSVVFTGFNWDLIAHPAHTELFHLSTFPVAIGLISFAYAGHGLFPSVYVSMKEPEKFGRAMAATWSIAITLYSMMAICGYLMFGNNTHAVITTNLMDYSIIGIAATAMVMLIPFMKFALNMHPITEAVESFCWTYVKQQSFWQYAIRVAIVALCYLVAVTFPFFGLVNGFIGSMFSISIFLLFPCGCYVKMYWNELSRFQRGWNLALIGVGIGLTISGTTCAVIGMAEKIQYGHY